ncbi:unnamed protein product [Vitrella brassicaformis CCMP3155]|uniref:Uncharacterized protein n=1 Tax=Vitrella brassicaformis (strain CCMP3155) TaxID=1169540 RepID=A0A0G4EFG8_VITBC|nr:unnamed protein product [Vitrella brassicaformis CCMP3155]|eukprot:CEL94741.1 unnamed protein product [Vitrella brassicaformis CCMP3155]
MLAEADRALAERYQGPGFEAEERELVALRDLHAAAQQSLSKAVRGANLSALTQLRREGHYERALAMTQGDRQDLPAEMTKRILMMQTRLRDLLQDTWMQEGRLRDEHDKKIAALLRSDLPVPSTSYYAHSSQHTGSTPFDSLSAYHNPTSPSYPASPSPPHRPYGQQAGQRYGYGYGGGSGGGWTAQDVSVRGSTAGMGGKFQHSTTNSGTSSLNWPYGDHLRGRHHPPPRSGGRGLQTCVGDHKYCYIVMEMARGTTVAELLARKKAERLRVPEELRRRIMACLLRAVDSPAAAMASAAASESLPWGPWTTDEEMFQIYADQNQRWRDLWQKLAPGRPWSEAMDLVFLYEDKEYLQKRVKEWRDRAQIYQTSVVKLKERQEVLLQMLAQKEKASKALEADKKAMAAEIEALKAKPPIARPMAAGPPAAPGAPPAAPGAPPAALPSPAPLSPQPHVPLAASSIYGAPRPAHQQLQPHQHQPHQHQRQQQQHQQQQGPGQFRPVREPVRGPVFGGGRWGAGGVGVGQQHQRHEGGAHGNFNDRHGGRVECPGAAIPPAHLRLPYMAQPHAALPGLYVPTLAPPARYFPIPSPPPFAAPPPRRRRDQSPQPGCCGLFSFR